MNDAQIARILREDIEQLIPIYGDTSPTATLKGVAPTLIDHLTMAAEALEGKSARVRADAVGDTRINRARDR